MIDLYFVYLNSLFSIAETLILYRSTDFPGPSTSFVFNYFSVDLSIDFVSGSFSYTGTHIIYPTIILGIETIWEVVYNYVSTPLHLCVYYFSYIVYFYLCFVEKDTNFNFTFTEVYFFVFVEDYLIGKNVSISINLSGMGFLTAYNFGITVVETKITRAYYLVNFDLTMSHFIRFIAMNLDSVVDVCIEVCGVLNSTVVTSLSQNYDFTEDYFFVYSFVFNSAICV